MAEVLFYHLTRSTLEQALAKLLVRSLGRGWRVAVRGTDPDRMARLDDALWDGDGFLPHGIAGGDRDAAQPILLTCGPAMPNGATCLIAVDGAQVAVDEVQGLERTSLLFDGDDAAAVGEARGLWRRVTKVDIPAQYWSEETGSWAMKARHPSS